VELQVVLVSQLLEVVVEEAQDRAMVLLVEMMGVREAQAVL
jgi:hypothetical protein